MFSCGRLGVVGISYSVISSRLIVFISSINIIGIDGCGRFSVSINVWFVDYISRMFFREGFCGFGDVFVLSEV